MVIRAIATLFAWNYPLCVTAAATGTVLVEETARRTLINIGADRLAARAMASAARALGQTMAKISHDLYSPDQILPGPIAAKLPRLQGSDGVAIASNDLRKRFVSTGIAIGERQQPLIPWIAINPPFVINPIFQARNKKLTLNDDAGKNVGWAKLIPATPGEEFVSGRENKAGDRIVLAEHKGEILPMGLIDQQGLFHVIVAILPDGEAAVRAVIRALTRNGPVILGAQFVLNDLDVRSALEEFYNTLGEPSLRAYDESYLITTRGTPNGVALATTQELTRVIARTSYGRLASDLGFDSDKCDVEVSVNPTAPGDNPNKSQIRQARLTFCATHPQ